MGVEGFEVLRRRAVGPAPVDVTDRRPGVVGAPVLRPDFVREEGQVRLLVALHLGADAGDGDDEGVGQEAPRWRSSGTTQVPVARATTSGGSRTRAPEPPDGAITFLASNRISRAVLPTRTISASTSR